MPNTITQHTGDGSNALFSVPFPYLDQSHVKVTVGPAECVLGAHFDFINATTIRFMPGFIPAVNSLVQVRRVTPTAAAVSYQNGAILLAEDLNTATLQSLFLAEETKDYYEAALVAGFAKLTNGAAVSATEAIDAAVQSVLDSALLSDLQSRITDIDSNAEAHLANTSSIVDMQTQVDALNDFGVGFGTSITNLQTQIDALTDFDETIDTQLTNEQTARVDGDTALASTIALIGAKNGGGTAFVLDMSTVEVSTGLSLGTRLSGIDTSLGANAAAIATETTARTTADTALASSVSSLAATVTSGDSTNAAAISSEATARASADSAFAATIALIGAKNSGGTAFVLDMSTVEVSTGLSLGTRLSGIDTSLGTNSAAIASEATARSAADSALSSTLSALAATVTTGDSTNAAAISSEASARASADSALSTTISNVSAVASAKNRIWRQNSAPTASADGDLWLDADDNNKAYRWDGSTWVATDDARIAANIAAISSEATARASADSALASTVSTLASTVSTGDATNAAAISTEATTRASADSALSSSISTLSSTVGGHTSSLSTIATVQAGLTAQYMVKTDVNGRVAGFGLYDDGATSEFIVLADKFAIVDPAAPSGTPFVPFVVTGGVVYMDDVVIGDALIDSLTVSKLTAGTLDVDFNIGTGVIRGGQTAWATGTGFWLGYDGGTYKFSLGVGTSSGLRWDGSQFSMHGTITANGRVLGETGNSGPNTSYTGGFSANPTGEWRWVATQGICYARWVRTANGTSNGSEFGFTLPAGMPKPSAAISVFVRCVQGSTIVPCNMSIGTTGICSVYLTDANTGGAATLRNTGVWNTTGAKGIDDGAVIVYPLD